MTSEIFLFKIRDKIRKFARFGGSHSGVAEDSSLSGCEVV